MDKTQIIPWFAGLFEGEGYFVFYNGKPRNMGINMTDEDVIRHVHASFGGTVIELSPQKEHHKKQWRWTIFGEDALALAREIEPFLFSRRKAKCQEFIENYVTLSQYRAERTAVKEQKHQEVRELRERGLTHRQIADRLGISRWYVGDILRGRYTL